MTITQISFPVVVAASAILVSGIIGFVLGKNSCSGRRNTDDVTRIRTDMFRLLEPLNSMLKAEAKFSIDITLWTRLEFRSAIQVFHEALGCFSVGLYEACMVMCRNALDSSIYSGVTWIRQNDPSSQVRREASLDLLKELWNWQNLKRFGLQFHLLDDQLLQYSKVIRDAGSFSAHFASAQDKEEKTWWDEHKQQLDEFQKSVDALGSRGPVNLEDLAPLLSTLPPPSESYKIRTHYPEAKYVLELTEICLVKIIVLYYTGESTKSPDPLG